MDGWYSKFIQGWETRRKRTLGHDWCIIELGLSGQIVGIDANTAFFTGNNVPAISIQAASLESPLLLKPSNCLKFMSEFFAGT